MLNMITHADSDASCVFVPSSYGYRGGSVTSFIFTEPLSITGFVFNAERGSLVVQSPAVGSVTCVLQYLPPAEVVQLCDAVASAVSKGVAIRLARVPQASRGWFCGIVLADTPVPTEEVFSPIADARPWANWSAK
jgi:hypothetical protein